jgi:diguanylate cyclase (GGDEF)-like protein
MLAESYLRTRTQILLYFGSFILFFLLALQNVRYGNYSLFYTGMLTLPALIAGAVYAWFKRSELSAHIGHLIVLVYLLLLVLNLLARNEPAILHWLYGLGLFSFLLLPLKTAFNFNLAVLLASSLISLYSYNFLTMLRFATSFALLVGLAGMYAYLYHDKARYLVEAGIKDALTGAYNMRHWDLTLCQEVSRSEATHHPLSLLLMEIDYFDQTLEVNGQNVTNVILSELGKRLLTLTRAGDSIYHAGNGRFLFMLPTTQEEGLLVFAERLRRSIENTSWPTVESMSASIGCLTRRPGEEDIKSLMDNLQKALAQAQHSGHNKVVLFKH